MGNTRTKCHIRRYLPSLLPHSALHISHRIQRAKPRIRLHFHRRRRRHSPISSVRLRPPRLPPMPQSAILRIDLNPTDAHGNLVSLPNLVRHRPIALPPSIRRLQPPRRRTNPPPRAPHNLRHRPRVLRRLLDLNHDPLIRVLAVPLALRPRRRLSAPPGPRLGPEPAPLCAPHSRQPGRGGAHLPADGRDHGLHRHAGLGCDYALASVVREGAVTWKYWALMQAKILGSIPLGGPMAPAVVLLWERDEMLLGQGAAGAKKDL